MLRTAAFASLLLLTPVLASAQEPPPPAPPKVRVHITADSPKVTLYELTPEGWGRPICRVDCEKTLVAHPDERLFFAGEGIRPSQPFSLAGRGDEVHLDVKAATRADRGSAVGAIIFGGLLTGGGLFVAAMGSFWSREETHFIGSGEIATKTDRAPFVIGGIMAGGGLAFVTGGVIAVAVAGARTRVTFAAPLGLKATF